MSVSAEVKKLFILTLFLSGLGTVATTAEGFENKLLPKGSPPADIVDVVDLKHKSADIKLPALCLQGLINSGQQSKVYFLLEDAPSNTSDAFWLDWLKKQKHIKGYRQLTYEEFFNKYGRRYKSVIIYDPVWILLSTLQQCWLA